jgi:hypothetical protein
MVTIRKTLSACLAACVTVLAGAGQGKAATVPDWRHDIDEIVKDIRLLHPDPFAKTGRLTFLREAEALKVALPSLTEEERVVRAMRLVASLQDGHTHLEPDAPAFADWYPVRLYEFTDGLFVTSAHRSVSELAGARVLEIAGRPAGGVVAEARKLLGADNAFDARERLYAVHSAALMKGLGYTAPDGRLRVKFQLHDGKVEEHRLAPRRTDDPRYKADDSTFEWQYRTEVFGLPFGTDKDWVSAYKGLPASAFDTEDTSRPPHLTCRGLFVARPMPQQDAYFVQVNQVNDTTFVTFFQTVMRDVDRARPRRLILDWRYNYGGDGSKVNFVIREFIKRSDNPPWKELYILTGRKTFSAAIMALDVFLRHTQFTTVGEPTGSALNHFGDPTVRNYPRTGLRMTVSTLRHQLSSSDDLSEFIPVDVPAPFSFTDYAAGRDPAVDAILRGEEMRSIPVIALSDGGAAARRAYEDRKARFAKYGWWAPPREIDLRHVAQALRHQKRVTDALEACRLNAEMHPYVWNVWLNLGSTQRAAGHTVESLRSLRRVLELDPNNFNADVIRPILADGLKPGVVRYGATVAEMQTRLASVCKTAKPRPVEPPYLPDVKAAQVQLECDGLPFLGRPRRAEFIFRDDSLELVRVITTADEQGSILKSLTDANDPPTERNSRHVAFAANRTVLRLDRPEVLFYSERLAPHLRSWFDKSSAATPAPK